MLAGTVDLVQIIARKHSLNDFDIENDLTLLGKSGTSHKFDLVIRSKNGEKSRLVVLKNISDDFVKDVTVFNSYAEDCGIEIKEVIVDRDLDEKEIDLLSVFHISATDLRSNPAAAECCATFGIGELDRKLGYSITKGNIYMLSGKAGSGKTMLCAQFLISGARLGEKGAIILTDSKKERFISAASHLPHFDEYHKDGVIEVIEISDVLQVMKTNLLSDPRNYGKFISKVTGDIRKGMVASNIQRLVIDTITPLIIEDGDFINHFFEELVMKDSVILVTSGLRKSDLSFYGIEEYYVSGIIKLNNEITLPRKKAVIVKMRGSQFDHTPYYFNITNQGFVPA